MDGIWLEIEPGQVALVVGPSGSGKSTLALALAGLLPREIPAIVTGQLELDGVDVRDLGPVEVGARVGMVFQDPSSQIVLERVEDDVAFGLENRSWPLEAMRRRVPAALAAVGLQGHDRRRSHRLSGGQQQRLALAGALAPDPGLLILDEPTANLDPSGAEALLAALRAIRADRSATVVLIEHRIDAAWAIADVVLALDGAGRPIDVGARDEVAARSAARMAKAGIWLPAALDRGRTGGRGRKVALGEGGARASTTEPSPGAPLLHAAAVRYGYDRGTPAVRDASLTIGPGERIALVGPNGSGKSTLARLLVGLLRPDHGAVALGGGDPSRLPAPELARRAGYVFQEPERQFLAQTVREEVELGLTPDEVERVPSLMARLSLPLESFAERSPYRLSGGEQRRLSLACILVRRPAVLVLDEPTFGQDRLGYEGLLDILAEHLDHGACLIAATHDERFVADVASRVIELDEGWIVRDEVVA
ncbi:MAG TPA: ATP-binding cassette domain-containing protein [Candidatus Saccharimonadales bacterium]|nr:ATP-binding cassette domain-containing protein [Candidatus Saccharimonadales bacterium]